MADSSSLSRRRSHALAIWQAAVAAAHPETLLPAALADPKLPLHHAVQEAKRILVVGGGKAGTAMSKGVVDALAGYTDRIFGWVNVPADTVRPLKAVHLHGARPAGSNQPTAAGVAGAEKILDLLGSAGPEDVALCLLSGGGSALMPAPVPGVTLEEKQQVTLLLHECGATINEMNTVRKHLSRIKGGRLAQAFTGRSLHSLIISDVVGDPLEVIASGPTAADPTTFADALAVLEEFELLHRVPAGVRDHLQCGAAGLVPETLKSLPENVHNHVIGNNVKSLAASQARAEGLGYQVLNLGSYIEGETRQVATVLAGVIRSIRAQGVPVEPPVCLLSGGETTVTLAPCHGQGGRNQELVLAMLAHLGSTGLDRTLLLSGGTDGEDGPTDAAGALADETTWPNARHLGLSPRAFLDRNDAYHFFAATGDLLRTGLTQTNVMDVRVSLLW
jgi:hydroxypyruvate reductase/glycerate 2-kinase